VDVVVLLGVVILVSRVVILARGNAPLARLVLGGIAVFGFCVLADLLAEYGALPWVQLVPGAPGAFWGGFLLLIFTFGVATAQRWTLSEMQAGIDPLTGLASRRVLDDELAAEVERVKAGGRSCLLLIDLDGFKRVNDVHGHVKGDEVLRCVGLLLRQHARPGDLAARLGGEEMAVLLRDVDLPRARELAERLRAAVEVMTVPIPGGALSVTASVGVAAATPGHDKTALVHAADKALYMAKAQGRNRVIAA
jgi:diguanylate cyclase (GGDEF)-like protein